MITYNICYDVVAIVLLVLILLLYGMKKRIPSYQNRLFVALIIGAIICTFCDIADATAINLGSMVPIWLKYLTSGSCYIVQVGEAMLVLVYIYGYTQTWNKMDMSRRFIILIPMVIETLLVCTTYDTHLVFYFDEAGTYIRGNGQLLAVAIAIVYLLIAAGSLWKIKRFISLENRIVILIIVIISIVGVSVQMTFPGQLTQSFSMAVCLYIVFFTIQNPFLEIDTNLNVYNKKSFLSMMNVDYLSVEPFILVVVELDDFDFLKKSMGVKQCTLILSEIGQFLKTLKAGTAVYHTSESGFSTTLHKQSEESILRFMDEIEDRFDKPWMINGTATMLSVHICRVNLPGDVENIDDVLDLFDYIRFGNHTNKRLSAFSLNVLQRKARLELEQQMQDAIEYSKFEDYNQGIYHVATECVEGVEVDLKILSEDRVFLFSEKSSLILEEPELAFRTGIYLFRKACALLAKERAREHGIKHAEINVSIFVCMQREFLNEMKWILKEYHIEPGAVILRILEDEAMESQAELKHMMNVMTDAGVAFSLGNYGTGYSNISFVYELPFSRVEITKQVFMTALVDERARTILKNSIDMFNELKMDIVVSGADTEHAKQAAIEMGCSHIKGTIIPNMNVEF